MTAGFTIHQPLREGQDVDGAVEKAAGADASPQQGSRRLSAGPPVSLDARSGGVP